MNRLKVAWLHSHFDIWMGGTKFIYEVTSRLQRSADIEIYVESADPTIAARFRSAGIPVTEILGRSSNSAIYWLFFPYYLWKDLRAFKKRIRHHDTVVANVFPMNWLASRLDKPYVFFCFDPFLFFYDRQMICGLPFAKRVGAWFLGVFYKGLDKAGTGKAKKILTLNNTTAGWIKNVYGYDALVTYAGVDTDMFYKRPTLRLGDPFEGKRFIIHSTDYSPIKGTASVIEAFAKVRKTLPDVHLVVTHTREDNPAQVRLVEQADRLCVSQYVTFAGFVETERLAELYSAAAVLVAPGRGMSLPVQEAMASETPVVRNIANTDEVVHGESGFLVDTTNTDDFAEAIITILNNPEKARLMGKAGRNTIASRFSWNKVSQVVFTAIADLR